MRFAEPKRQVAPKLKVGTANFNVAVGEGDMIKSFAFGRFKSLLRVNVWGTFLDGPFFTQNQIQNDLLSKDRSRNRTTKKYC